MRPVPILIPAAGASARMRGGDKLLEKVGGEALLRRQARAARAVSPVVLVTLPAGSGRGAVLAGLDVKTLEVPDAAEGMAASLRAGVAALPECDAFLILLPDLVGLTAADMAAVIAAGTGASGAACIWRGQDDQGRPGHPILFPAHLRPAFAGLSGDQGARDLLKLAEVRAVPLPGDHATRDLDTPEDWAAWRAGLSGRAP